MTVTMEVATIEEATMAINAKQNYNIQREGKYNMMKKSIIASAAFVAIGGFAEASMADQLIYNVLGQVTNAAGARLGDEIYYGNSRSSSTHRKKRPHRRKALVVTPEMKIQIALSSLGFYHGKIDGQINSFETRSAIKQMNMAYGISSTASLLPEEKDSLVYLGTLFEFDRNLIARGTDRRTKGKKIQTALKIEGFYPDKIDGVIGRGTRRNISEYKLARGLSAGGSLDFEEEYQLISSAKAKNDRNIEETIASLKAMGRRQMPPATQMSRAIQPAAPQTAPAQRQMQQMPSQMVSPVQQQMPSQVVRPVQRVQPVAPQNAQMAAPVQQMQPAAAAPQVSQPQTSQQTTDDSSLQMYTDGK